jgi:hypothetical protein
MIAPYFTRLISATSQLLMIGLVLTALTVTRAQAVPAFADQTGQPCSSCHVGGFGPQLTPFGREFKILGYTVRSQEGTVPVSAMAVASYLHTAANQAAAPHYAPNDNVALDQVSVFLAGGFNKYLGGFSQFTYDGVARAFSWDNLDLRVVDQLKIGGTDVVAGLSLNNNPTIQDPWNTLSGWGFPYTDSALAPSPGTATILNGGLAQSSLGITAYAWWNSEIYAEAGLYTTPGRGFMRAVGADGGAVIRGSAPYVRLGYQKDYDDQNFQFGVTAFSPSLYPGGDRAATATDNYQDIGVDGSYQYVGDGSNVYQLNARYTHERQSLGATYALGGADNSRNTLDEYSADLSYYWKSQVGLTAGYFNTAGSSDSTLYAGNRTAKPNSAGFIFQLDDTPFGETASSLGNHLNLRVGIQYRLFTQFNGAASNYDAAGSNSSGNDTVRVFTWVAL